MPVIVRLTRNTSAVNRVMLENAGVRWNGRSGVWSGRVTPSALERLRDVFPDRVELSAAKTSAASLLDQANAQAVDGEAEEAPVALPEAPPVAVIDVPAEAETVRAETPVALAQPSAPATRLPTSPFRLPAPRRLSPT
ncbi:hypothetical protein [Bradyrhizobium yuanmingense]|uniref:hypothetical protein n=1 Tax=Bradyrhizobium yuanmingense TaxID=108015 RepID=UPI001CD47C9C|nr:hypothetical protein [Bradyrhizobium yuanmingense]MCA1526504.1 hypothetical protein [Bradyrhizobium yuanmingense]